MCVRCPFGRTLSERRCTGPTGILILRVPTRVVRFENPFQPRMFARKQMFYCLGLLSYQKWLFTGKKMFLIVFEGLFRLQLQHRTSFRWFKQVELPSSSSLSGQTCVFWLCTFLIIFHLFIFCWCKRQAAEGLYVVLGQCPTCDFKLDSLLCQKRLRVILHPVFNQALKRIFVSAQARVWSSSNTIQNQPFLGSREAPHILEFLNNLWLGQTF